MQLNTFIESAESTLIDVREHLVHDRTPAADVAEKVRVLAIDAREHGLSMIAEASENFAAAIELNMGQMPGGDETVRVLSDRLASVESLVLGLRLSEGDANFDLGDFLDASFDNLRLDNGASEAENSSVSAIDDDFEIDAEMLEIFADEAKELLQTIDENLRLLSAAPSNREALWEIRRSAHTFKGSAGIVGLKASSELAHRIEDLLDLFSERQLSANSSVIAILHTSSELLRTTSGGDNSTSLKRNLEKLYKQFDEIIAGFSTVTLEPASASVPEPNRIDPEAGEIAAEMRADNIDREQSRGQSSAIVRVPIMRLTELARSIEELAAGRTAAEQQLAAFEKQVEELHNTTRRLRSAGHKLETSFEVLMLGGNSPSFARPASGSSYDASPNFDSLEMDRYNGFHECTRGLLESANDSFEINTALGSIKESINELFRRQQRLIEEAQDKLRTMRVVEFGSILGRLQRAVRVACDEDEKQANVFIENPELEIDAHLLEYMIEPLMHLLRNAVVHGIEPPEVRRLFGKPEAGKITVSAFIEETNIVLRLSDDGRGISIESLKEKAVATGVMTQQAAAQADEEQSLELLFVPGFTTAAKVTMTAGRGVGMSIVKDSVEDRNGTVSVETVVGNGTVFTLCVPLGLASCDVLLVRAGGSETALPLGSVKLVFELESGNVRRVKNEEFVETPLGRYPVKRLRDHLSCENEPLEQQTALVFENSNLRCALVVDEVIKRDTVVLKRPGRLLEELSGVLAAGILANGNAVSVIDLPGLLKKKKKMTASAIPAKRAVARILIVDDSPSVRHMTSRTVKNAGWEVSTARDGLEALESLNQAGELPAVVLTDVEMPKMNGYELAAAIRKSERLRGLPVVFITSRSSRKHHEMAEEAGVTEYLAKPFEEADLVNTIKRLIAK